MLIIAARCTRRFHAAAIVSLLVLAGVAVVSPSGGRPASAQVKEPLMPRVAGHEYVRSEFDRNEELIGRQEILIGPLGKEGDRTWFTASVKAYDEAGQLREQVEVKVVCDVRDPVMLVAFLDLLGSPGERELDVEVDSDGPLVIFPVDPGDSLSDLRLEVKAKGGWRGLLGGRKTVTVWNRTIERLGRAVGEDSSGTFIRIREEITLKSYALGIRLRSRSYRGLAELDATGGLTRYELYDSGRVVFAIERRMTPPPLIPRKPQ